MGGKIAGFIEQRYSLADLDRDMNMAVYGVPTSTGVDVSQVTALRHVTYFDGLRLLSETTGQVPLIMYRRVMRGREPGRRGKERAVEETLYLLLHDQPNPEMDAISFKSAMQGHAVSWGNAFAEIDWDMEAGEPRALWPLDVSKMKVGRDDRTHELIYAYTVSDGTTKILPAFRVMHLAGFGFNGVIGYDPVFLMRETLGLAMALQKNAGKFFGNGSRPGAIITHPNQLKKEAKERMRDSWEDAYGGLEQGHRVAILDEGITYKEIGIPPDNAQFLESRRFSIVEIAQLLNLPVHMLKDLERATFNNIEHLALEFLKYAMGPWFRRWEQVCNRKLILPEDRRIYFTEFLEDALLKADSAARAALYKELFYMGALSPNDIREKENMNPIEDPGGDRYYIQANMTPMDLVDAVAAGQAREAMKPKELREGDLGELTRRIAEREKGNLLRGAAREPERFGPWLDEFYRDFTSYIVKEAIPAIGDGAAAYASEYIRRSRDLLDGVEPGEIGTVLEGWEDRRSGEE